MDILKSLGKLFDKEKEVTEVLTETLKDVSTELDVPFDKLFIMIKPCDDKFNFKCWIYKLTEKAPVPVREITIKEILGDTEEGG